MYQVTFYYWLLRENVKMKYLTSPMNFGSQVYMFRKVDFKNNLNFSFISKHI